MKSVIFRKTWQGKSKKTERGRGVGRRYESEKLMDEYGKGDIKMQKTKIK